jgi:hypothetical protein
LRRDTNLAEQIVSNLASAPAREESVNRDLMTLDNLDERVRTAPYGLLDQRTVLLHAISSRSLALTCYCAKLSERSPQRPPSRGGSPQRALLCKEMTSRE